MKKIFIQTLSYRPEHTPIANRISSFVNSLLKDNWYVEILTMNYENCEEEKIVEQGNLKIIYSKHHIYKKKNVLNRLKLELEFYFITKRYISKNKNSFDYVLVSSPNLIPTYAGLYGKNKYKAKLIFDVRDIWPDVAIEMNSFGKNSIYSMVFNFISNRLYKCADIITTVSPGKVIKIKNKLKKEKNKVFLVENGFDDTMLNCNYDDEFSSKFKMKDYFTFCFCGKIGMAQGLDKVILLANHFRNNSNVRFIIAGDGVEKDKIKQHIEQQELKNIVFTGVVSFDQVKTILTDSSVALVPLKTKNMKDSVPTKLYESLAFGCPTLLVAAGDACDILDESHCGIHVNPGDDEGLINAANQLYTNHSEFIKRKDKAIESILKNHLRSTASKKFIEILNGGIVL